MTPHYQDDWLTVYAGDCRTVLASMESESVNCVVTSPPYWGLRDYGTATWEGGDEGCDHAPDKRGSRFATPVSAKQGSNTGSGTISSRDCRCGATRQDSQLGLEPTPEQYVENMVAVFREVRRVLRNDGTLWLNLGDSYYTQPAGNKPDKPSGFQQKSTAGESGALSQFKGTMRMPKLEGLKPKDLVGIPWRVAFALQADGWYLRSDIIWAKPNPMPESVTDRPTKSHEYLFLLAKSPRYYFDHIAVREAATTTRPELLAFGDERPDVGYPGHSNGRRREKGWPGIGPKHGTSDNHKSDYEPMVVNEGRNIRSVWTIPTQPYPGAHFAVFPPKLIEPCIKAGCPPAGKRCDCDEIILTPLGGGEIDDPSLMTGRAGYNRPRREDEGTRPITRREQRSYALQASESPHRAEMATAAGSSFDHYIRTDRSGARPLPPALLAEWRERGWLVEPAPCLHEDEPAGIVLDPFAGSGTTGMVAQSLSRRAVLIDLNPDYIDQQMKRNADIPLGLTA